MSCATRSRLASRARVLSGLAAKNRFTNKNHKLCGAQYLPNTIRGLVSASCRRAPEDSSAGAPTFIGISKRLPEFSLVGKVVLVSGAARGLGLVQAEALLEAGAIVYALDRLETPSPDFGRVQKRATEELGTKFEYRRIDVTDSDGLNNAVESIADAHGRMDGLIAAAGIQQETSALDYTAADAK
jgi:hypothetical protein